MYDAISNHGSRIVTAGGTALFLGGGCMWLTANWVQGVFGPEDVIPIMATGTAAVCCSPLAIGAGVIYGISRRGWHNPVERFANAWSDMRQSSRVIHQGNVPAPVVEEAPAVPAHVVDPLHYLMRDPLHILVIGHSGGGKTTLMHYLATEWNRQGQVVIVCDPQAANGLWPGCKVVGVGLNFQQIQRVLDKIKEEFDRRIKLLARGHMEFRDIYVILEEYKMIADALPETRQKIEDILRVGRKLNIHLILGVTDKQVKTLGFEGASSLLENFTFTVEATYSRKEGRRFLTITEGNDRSTQFTVITPRLPDPRKYIIRADDQADDGSTLEDRLGLTGRTAVTSEADTAVFNQNNANPVPPPRSPAGSPVVQTANRSRILAESVRSPGASVTIPIAPVQENEGSPAGSPVYEALATRVSELLTDTTDSPVDGLTVGMAQSMAMLMLYGYSQNLTMDVVLGGKNPTRHAKLKELMLRLENAIGAAD
ncbi:MAG: hypothetical protein IT327_02655 [Anaerolineae bacterium]|nr:hypothetical protein [Anaerolineae bacterium]